MEKFLKEIKNPTPGKVKQLYCWYREVLVVWIEDQTSYNIPLIQSLNQSKP